MTRKLRWPAAFFGFSKLVRFVTLAGFVAVTSKNRTGEKSDSSVTNNELINP